MSYPDSLIKTVANFLDAEMDFSKPVLLALSGGPDSMALLYLLLEYRKHRPFSLGIAHVDHGWREESRSEAEALHALATSLGLTFYLNRLDPEKIKGNLEALCREERLAFFAHVCAAHGYQAVLLAHHGDDQAETVLKNLLEGASFPQCGGMRKTVRFDHLLLWRPLLDIPKSELEKWLNEAGHFSFDDSTNSDRRFLRVRMRTQILPSLSHLFGKRVASNLTEIGKEAQELEDFLDAHLRKPLAQSVVGPFGRLLDLRNVSLSLYEARYLIRRVFGTASRQIVETAAKALLDRVANRRFVMGKKILIIDRKCVFVISTPLPPILKESIHLDGEKDYGYWKVKVTEGDREEKASDWLKGWEGEAQVILPCPDTPYRLVASRLSDPYPRSHPLRKWWNQNQTPAFLRSYFPVVYSGNSPVHEFLTGQTLLKIDPARRLQKILLTFQPLNVCSHSDNMVEDESVM